MYINRISLSKNWLLVSTRIVCFCDILDLQVHQLQQDDDPAVVHSGPMCQGSGWLCRHVLHHLPRLHSARLPALRNPGQGLQQLSELLVSLAFLKLSGLLVSQGFLKLSELLVSLAFLKLSELLVSLAFLKLSGLLVSLDFLNFQNYL